MMGDPEKRLARELAAMKRLHELVSRLVDCSDLTEALHEVLVASIEITRSRMGKVQLLNARGDALRIVAQRGFHQDLLDDFREVRLDDDTPCARAARAAERIIVEDVQTGPACERDRDLAAAAGYRAVQSTPIIGRNGQLFGVLSTHCAQPYRPSDHEQRALDLVARQAADFIERHRMLSVDGGRWSAGTADNSLEAELAAHTRVHEISCRLIPAEDVRTLYAELVDAAMEITQADRGTIQSIDQVTGELCLLETRGMPPQIWQTFARISPHIRTSCGEALRRGERVVVDYLTDDRVAATDEARAHLEAGIRSAQSTPLVTRAGRLVGMLSTHWNQPHQLPERQLRLLDIVARQAADLVERKLAEDALREGRERLRFAIEAGRLGDWELDLSTGKARTSFRHDQCFGATEPFQDWSYDRFLSYVHPEDRPEVQRRFDAAVAARREWHFECRVIWPDGSIHWIETHGTHYRDAAGEPRRMLGVVHEITERKLAEAQLRRSQETFFNLIQNSPFGVHIIDSQFRLRQVSLGAQKVFQNVRPLLGRDFAEVLRSIWVEPFASEAIARFRHTLATGQPYVARDTTERRQDVADIESYDWRIERITLPDGQFGVVCYFYDLSTIKRAEAELRHRSEQFETLINQAPLGVYLVDADFRLAQVNPAARPVFSGIPDVSGRPFDEVLQAMRGPEVADEIARVFRHTLETGEPFHHSEFAEHRADRDVTEYYDWRVDRITLPDGRYGVVCYFRDISEQVRARQAIAESKERYRTLFESIDEGFCVMEAILDEQGQVVDLMFVEVNPAFAKHTGVCGAAGRRLLELVPDLESYWIEIFGRVATTGEPQRFANEAKALEGRWFDLYAFRIGGPESRRVAVLFSNITERRRAEAEIRRRVEEAEEGQRILRGIMEYVPEGITVADAPDVTIRMVSRHGIELIKRPAETLLNEPDAAHPETWGIFHPDGKTLGRPDELPLTRAVRKGEVVINEEWLLRRPDGSDVTILCNAGPIRNSEGAITGGIIAWRDIAELKRAEEALKHADRRKDEFLATLAHELRNPLAAIRMAMDVLGQAQDDRALLAEMSSIIQRQSSHLTRLIDDLLDVSRITRGNVEIRIGRVDLCLIIKHAIDGARQMCEAKGLNLSVTLPAQKIMIDADPVRFTQVISNLLNNACKFTDHGGAVYVTARQEGDEGIISVRDTGIGIAPPELPRIFDMFVQLGDQRSRAAGGLGIGLSLARSIIEMHGGTIEATSQGPGRGTEFIVRVPAVEPDEETVVDDADRGADAQSKRRVRRRRILVVDDNDDALESVASLLRLAGHEVLTAGSGRQALEKAQSNRPEIILLDIGMPEMDGYEVVRRIRSQPWGQHIFIVALTGWGQKKDKQHAFEAGFNAHLTKPADAESIERLLMEQSMVASLRRQDPCLH